MRYIHFDFTTYNGNLYVNPRPYLEVLSEVLPELPSGARSFVAEPSHYDFYGPRCVKDLTLRGLEARHERGELVLTLQFDRNRWKHDATLDVKYVGMSNLRLDSFDVSPWEELTRLGDVILDEVLPHEVGVTHEIAFHGGTISVVSRDLFATWTPSDPPNDRGQ